MRLILKRDKARTAYDVLIITNKYILKLYIVIQS